MHFNIESPLQDAADVKAFVAELGLELCGLVDTATLSKKVSEKDRPSSYSPRFRSAIVVGKAIYRGLSTGRHHQMRQFMSGRLKKRLEDLAGCLADTLEYNGHPALSLPTLALDHERQDYGELLPMAQGNWLVRVAAVEAGLGTLGLNNMLLTPRFGPRVFLAMVLTQLKLEPDAPLNEELCLGLEECGRCAVACPTRAIPRKAALGTPLAKVRGLDKAACAKACQPVASHAFIDFIRDAIQTEDTEERLKIVKGWRSGEIWQQMSMFKPGSLTGCMQCAIACPVGADFEAIKTAPDYPEINVVHSQNDGVVEVSGS